MIGVDVGSKGKWTIRKIEIKELPPSSPAFAPLPKFENEKPALRKAFHIRFQPNSNDLFAKVVRRVDGKDVEELYDPQIESKLREMAALSLLKANAPADGLKALEPGVVQLSLRRAQSVAEALVARHALDAKRISVVGMGWSRSGAGHSTRPPPTITRKTGAWKS